jgi:hypothetical protein
MSVLFDDYKKDLETVISSIELISTWEAIGKINEMDITPINTTETYQQLIKIKESYIKFKIDENVIRGSLILYSVGRFEMFVKQLVEDICIRFIKRTGEFEKLPKVLKENTIKYSGIVLQNPKRYGYSSNIIRQFISILNDNINNVIPFENINTSCLVITEENMRLEVIKELFDRIGAKQVVEKVSKQALILSFFQTVDSEHAVTEMKNSLNKIMDMRNSIAHPVPSFTWPSKEDILKNVEFLIKIGEALDDVSDVYVSALPV